jgi:peroxiredoxin|tara:strand:+ start:481 stop:1005 length:525 start_codon:yes stop_codon:yes gene_type:complete
MKEYMMNEITQVPQVNFRVRELGEWVDTNTDTYFKGKRVVLFSLPGAFTPTCSNQQLPGFEKQVELFKTYNIDDVYCISVNDSFVMNAWATDQKLENVKVIPDGNGQFTQEMGMLCQKRDKCFGQRSWRYAMVVNDGNIEQMFVEPGKIDDSVEDPYGESSPENVLKYLKSFKG